MNIQHGGTTFYAWYLT